MSDRPALPPQRDRVDGEWLDPPRGGIVLVHPDTDEEFGRSATTTRHTIDRAIAAAARDHAEGAWADRPVDERAELLLDLARCLDAMSEDVAYADAIDSGVPIGVTRMFAAGLADVVRHAADQARVVMGERELRSPGGAAHLLRVPWGPAAVLVPFNAPAFSAVKKTAYAIAAGCPVLLKPSPHAPHSASLLATAMAEVVAGHGAPPALFQLVHGDAHAGRRVSSDKRIRCLTFTGSRRAGRAVASAAAGDLKALQLECGSNNPAIVRADADIDTTADALVMGFTKLNGQWCERPGTVIVSAALHHALVEALLARLERLHAGPCLDPATSFGPQANRYQAQSVDDAVQRLERRGATVRRVFEEVSFGCFRGPTVISGLDPADALDEIFGPVLVVHAVADDSRALELAARLEGGLAAYVFTSDVEAGVAFGRRLPAGEVKINGTSVLDLSSESAQSFWTGSGLGGHGDAELLRFFTGNRIVGPDLPDGSI